MLQKTLKTTTAKLKVSIPEKLDDITLGQLIDLQENPNINDLEAISILANIPLQDLQNVSDIHELYQLAEPVLAFADQIKYLFNSDAIPQTITFNLAGGSKKINVMSNLSVEPAGAFMATREIIADEISEQVKLYGDDWQRYYNPSLKACCQVLAHYFYCRATGKPYNEYEAEEFTTEIKKLRVTEVLPISKHFFTCYPALSKPKTGYWHRLLQRWRNGQAYKTSKSLNISTP
ncbi:hypothetical protein JN11_04844 [Mucilaginibacter frigoritolerans]|uniref:Uncharacterized protein n=1 Tax=Mucilaginibacter frigoritolerans TaxID=652788 RepID=A0A562TKI3_9SPHI|nr:hypothetical protein [Mucilaginibacter frigoritolerans]TWI94027.1 hypothetical protein JN11_04844 [Mucilaginibacter frigoritolerans]